jgi:hypothetical protein
MAKVNKGMSDRDGFANNQKINKSSCAITI